MSRALLAAGAVFAALAVSLPLAPAEAQQPRFEPATLEISIASTRSRSIRVRSAQQIRKALRPCVRGIRCSGISIETCDRCMIYASAVKGGYSIHSRLGPPGPLYRLFDKRPGRRNRAVFSLTDTTTILIDYLTGRKTIAVGHRDTGEI